MSDKIDTVINPREKMGAREWLGQFLVHPALRARQQKRSIDEVPLLGEDESAVLAPVDTTRKPQIASGSWRALIAGSYRKVFLGDGYDPTENSVVTFNGTYANTDKGFERTTGGEEIRYQVVPTVAEKEARVVSLPEKDLGGVTRKGIEHVGHAVATFFGIPNRFEKLGTDGQLVFNGWTILKNYTGIKRNLFETKKPNKQYTFSIPGLNWGYVGDEYGFWQTLALPVKLVIGLPIKLALTVVKFALNIVKLATEFLPTLIVNGSAKLIRSLADSIGNTWTPKTQAEKDRGIGKRFGIYVGASLLIAALGALHYVGRVALLLGTALTAPAKLTKDAWDFAHTLEIKNSKGEVNTKATTVLNKVLGGFGILLSVALTVALWAVALPFGIAALVKHVPTFMAAVNWVLATPFIAPALGYVNGVLTVVGGYLSVFLPLANALAVSAGLQMTASVLAVGVSIGSIAAVVANIASPILDGISNWAAKRPSNSGPFSWIMARRTAKKGDADPSHDPLPESEPLPGARPVEVDDDRIVDEAIRALIIARQGQQAHDMVVAHGLELSTYFVAKQTKDGIRWGFKDEPTLEPETPVSEIARQLAASAETYDDDAAKATARAEARAFALTERDHFVRTDRAIADELNQVVQDIDDAAAGRRNN